MNRTEIQLGFNCNTFLHPLAKASTWLVLPSRQSLLIAPTKGRVWCSTRRLAFSPWDEYCILEC